MIHPRFWITRTPADEDPWCVMDGFGVAAFVATRDEAERLRDHLRRASAGSRGPEELDFNRGFFGV